MTRIVTVNTSILVAPTPPTLQSSVALVSQGGTTLAQNGYSYLTQLSDLTPLLSAGVALSGITQSGGLATATAANTTAASGTYNGTTGLVTLTLTASIGAAVGASVTVSSATGTGTYTDINGTFTTAAGSGGTTLTYTIATGLTLTITGADVQLNFPITTSDTFLTTIAGGTGTSAVYNGLVNATVATASTFTFAVPSSAPSPAVGTLTYTPRNVGELLQMATTFFAQGDVIGCYVLEMGAGEAAAGISALSTYLTNNPNTDYVPGAQGYFYAYCVPRDWDGQSTFLTLLSDYESDEAETYFVVTTTTSTYADYTDLMKSAITVIQAPNTILTEFDAAAILYGIAQYSPTNTNQVTSMCYRYVYGCTPYPTNGNAALFQSLQNAAVNIVGTGNQGGISLALLMYGTTMDGNDVKFWYSVDWAQINVAIDLANAIINGSNNPQNPLLYNQFGINLLQQVAQQTFNNGVAFAMFLSTTAQTLTNGVQVAASPTVTAVPFYQYVQNNPSDYKEETYKGLACIATPQNGFRFIVFNFTVSEFPLGGAAAI